MLRLLARLWEEDGQDVAEYAVMLAVILAVVVGHYSDDRIERQQRLFLGIQRDSVGTDSRFFSDTRNRGPGLQEQTTRQGLETPQSPSSPRNPLGNWLICPPDRSNGQQFDLASDQQAGNITTGARNCR